MQQPRYRKHVHRDVTHSRVLFVEDNADLRAVLAEAMQDAGFLVACAANCDEAMHLVRSHHFDLMVTDINLERPLAGLDVADRWREMDASAPLVFATAYPRADVRTRLRLRSGDGYLTKPFETRELLSVIKFVMHARARTIGHSDDGSALSSDSGGALSPPDTAPWIV